MNAARLHIGPHRFEGQPNDLSDHPLAREARIISRCLLRVNPTQGEVERYAKAMRRTALPLGPVEEATWRLMLRRPSLFNPVDAALALRQPHSPIRQRIHVMLAILEASPNHTEHFLSGTASRAQLATLPFIGVAAIVKAVIGLVVIQWMRRTSGLSHEVPAVRPAAGPRAPGK